jgi:hypothetical protein
MVASFLAAPDNLLMARASLVLSVLVASPSDVPEERAAVVNAINQWNSEHSRKTKIHLEAVRWETHAYPATGGRPQSFVNTQIADDCDLAIAVFGRRVGTPTGEAESGSIEEVELLRSKGKPVALYFSNAPLPRDFDRQQFEGLKKFQELRKADSLVWEFSDAKTLEGLVKHHLPKLVEEAHKSLRETGQIEEVEAQLRNSKQTVSQDLKRMAGGAAESLELDEHDPKVCLEPLNAEFTKTGTLPFEISNRGQRVNVAHRIVIEPIDVAPDIFLTMSITLTWQNERRSYPGPEAAIHLQLPVAYLANLSVPTIKMATVKTWNWSFK